MTEIEDKVDRNQHVKTIQPMLGAKSLAIGIKELVEYSWREKCMSRLPLVWVEEKEQAGEAGGREAS